MTSTLLVGIGGTGAKIVDRIVAKAKRDGVWGGAEHKVLILDTDKGEIEGLKHVDPIGDVTRFSTSETIYNILENNPGVEDAWMISRGAREIPADQLNMSLDAGCKQVRVFTRLAMENAVKNFKNDPDRNPHLAISNKIRELKRHRQDVVGENVVKAMVFGSLAGATGSGSFTQIALVLRQSANEEEIANFQISGVFLLPDVYAKTVIPPSQKPNILSNGFASLKELNALNVLANMPEREADFKFEYMPGLEVRPGGQPYNQITLIDYESRTGAMSPRLDSYLTMAARTGYILGFTTYGRMLESSAVNDANQIVEGLSDSKTRNVSGIGVAALNYPVESNKEYLAKRLVLENLRGNWTTVDDLVDVDMEINKRERQTNPETERLDFADVYLAKFEDLRKNARTPFFKRIALNLAPKPDNEQDEAPPKIHISYLDLILKKVSEEFWSLTELTEVRDRSSTLSPTVFKATSKISQIVGNKEAELRSDFSKVSEALRENQPESKFQSLLQIAERTADVGHSDWQVHDLQYHLIGQKPHPVQARVFLYRLKAEIESRLGDAARRPDAVHKTLLGNADPFRTPEERERGEFEITSPGTMNLANVATLSNMVDRIRKKKRSDMFVSRYVKVYDNVSSGIKSYAQSEINFRVMGLILKEVNALLETYTGLFAEIRSIKSTLQNGLLEAEQAYDPARVGTDGNVWVYADGPSLNDAWDRLEARTLALDVDEEVNERLAISLYDIHTRSREKGRSASFAEIRHMFHREVVDTFGRNVIVDQFSDVWDFSVIEAFKRQHEVRTEATSKDATGAKAGPMSETEAREHFNAALANALAVVRSQADPYLLVKAGAPASSTKYWALNPVVQDDLNDDAAFNRMFTGDGVNHNDSDEYSSYEIICISLAQLLDLSELEKLDRGSDDRHQSARDPGTYYAAYQEHVARNLEDESNRASATGVVYSRFVPHIDKTWHRPLVLPEIDVVGELELWDAASRAYVAAEFMGWIDDFKEKNYAPRLNLRTGHSPEVTICGGYDRYDAVQAFRKNSHLVDAVLRAWEQEKGAASTIRSLKGKHKFVKSLEIMTVRNDGRGEQRERQTRKNLKQWLALLSDAITTQNTGAEAEGRDNITARAAEEAVTDAIAHIDGNDKMDGMLKTKLRALLSEELLRPQAMA